MGCYWSSFALSGDPNVFDVNVTTGTGNGCTPVAWPPYSEPEPELGLAALGSHSLPPTGPVQRLDAPSLIAPMYGLKSTICDLFDEYYPS